MRYRKVVPALFLRRPNRFVAHVETGDGELVVHVKNTGRCGELLLPGARVYLAESGNPARKTGYDLVAVEKRRPKMEPLLVNIDSQAPNNVTGEWLPASGLFPRSAVIRRETTWRNSRFDFYIEDGPRKAFMEVKGVTQEIDGKAFFPDAPTERGVKHIHELIECMAEGFGAYMLFVVQMKGVKNMRPNDATHPAFGQALRKAAAAGVRLLAMDCLVTPDSLSIDKSVDIIL